MADAPADLAALHGLSGTAYRWYAQARHVREDDLLVRSLAGDLLHRAAEALRAEETAQRQALPPPSRQHPFPDADLAARLDQFRLIQARLQALETRLRGAPCLPDRDFSRSPEISAALRDRLVRCDADLLAASGALAGSPPASWGAKLTDLENAIAARGATLAAGN
jgi:hypothetical protein